MPEVLSRPYQYYLQSVPSWVSAVAGPALVVFIMITGCTSAKSSGNFEDQGLLLMSPGEYMVTQRPHSEVKKRERGREWRGREGERERGQRR